MKKIILTCLLACTLIFANAHIGGKYNALVYDQPLPDQLPTHYYLTLVENNGNYAGSLRTARADGINEVTHVLSNVVVNETAHTISFEANNVVYNGTIVNQELHITIQSQVWVFKP